MPLMNTGSDNGRYIVRAQDATRLKDFIASVQTNPQMVLLETIGPADHPHTAIFSMPHDTARALQERYAQHLTIEPDQPLSLFGDRLL